MDDLARRLRSCHVSRTVRPISTQCHPHHRHLRHVRLHSPHLLPHHTNNTSSWAISCWAPFAFLGVEINRLSSTPSYVPLGRNSIELDSPSTLHLQQPESEQQSTGEGSGKYLGIMNVYTTLPQFVGTGISFVVFSLLEPGKSPELSDAPEHEHHSTDGVNAISVCLFIGAMCAVVAGFTTAKLGRIAKY